MVSMLSESRTGDAKRVLIVGGSTRAAARSAIRAGFQPVCADLFADLDTRQIAEVIAVRSYPDSLPDDVANVRADGWFYTGALENRPDLIEQMERPGATYGPLWGASAAALARIRNPFWLAETLCRHSRLALSVLPQAQIPPADGAWMRKPVSSAGGRAICVWDDQALPRTSDEPIYFQERKNGTPLSALYHRSEKSLQLLGMTQQLIGHELSHASEPFAYCGSIGPLWQGSNRSDLRERALLTAAVEPLASQSGLTGIFGVDFIRDECGDPWILEVNPRYTASVEILELGRKQSLLFTPDGLSAPQPEINNQPASLIVAKMILYARQPMTAPDFGALWKSTGTWDVAELADIPVPGTRIEATWPICTVLSSGTSEGDCLKSLQSRVDTAWKMVNHRAPQFQPQT